MDSQMVARLLYYSSIGETILSIGVSSSVFRSYSWYILQWVVWWKSNRSLQRSACIGETKLSVAPQNGRSWSKDLLSPSRRYA